MSGRIISADIKKNGVPPEVEQTYGAFFTSMSNQKYNKILLSAFLIFLSSF